MPSGYNSGYKDVSADAFPWPQRYWEYVFEELPHVCAAMFPISAKREDTFAAGLSMGAIAATKWAVYGAGRCSAVLLMSGAGMEPGAVMSAVSQDGNGSTDFNVDVEKLGSQGIRLVDPEIYQAIKRNAEEGITLPKIFMTCGGDDFIRSFVYASRDLFEENGYDVMYEEVPGYTHEWDFWDLSLRRAFNEWLPIRHDVILK